MRTKSGKGLLPAGLLLTCIFWAPPLTLQAQGPGVDDLLAGLKRNVANRPRLRVDVLFTREFHNTTDIGRGGAAPFPEAPAIPPYRKFIRVEERMNQVLTLSSIRVGDPFPGDIGRIFPVSFDPNEWTEEVDERLKVTILNGGDRCVVYDHFESTNASNWTELPGSEGLDTDLATSNFCGFPFEIRSGELLIYEYGPIALFGSEEASVSKLENGNWFVKTASPQWVILFGDGTTSVTARFARTLEIAPDSGYLPLNVTEKVEYFNNGTPIDLHEDWKAAGDLWTIVPDKVQEHFYPRRIDYCHKVPASDSDNLPNPKWTPRNFIRVLESGMPRDARIINREIRTTEVLSVDIMDEDAPPLEIKRPSGTRFIDRNKNRDD